MEKQFCLLRVKWYNVEIAGLPLVLDVTETDHNVNERGRGKPEPSVALAAVIQNWPSDQRATATR